MKAVFKKIVVGGFIAAILTGGIIFDAAHIDAPAVTGHNSTSTGADITDIYAFQSPEPKISLRAYCQPMF